MKLLALILVLLLQLSSCSQILRMKRDYPKALGHGLETIPAAREFQELFPNAHNFYSYYTGTAGPPILNCKAALYDRYELSLQVRVSFDDTRTRVISYGEPTFYLNEVESVTPLSDGTTDIRSGDLHLKFGAQDWKKVYDARGDFSALGVKLTKDKPVPNFEDYWRAEGKKVD